MNGSTTIDRASRLETLVAELTVAAYRVALQAGTQGNWVDLQLGLWRAMADRVRAWEHDARPCPVVVN
jgi:hypothetical protein